MDAPPAWAEALASLRANLAEMTDTAAVLAASFQATADELSKIATAPEAEAAAREALGAEYAAALLSLGRHEITPGAFLDRLARLPRQ